MTPAARSSLSRALGTVSIAIGLLAPSPARAQTTDTIAEALFLKAQEKMAAHDVDGACELFAKSLKVDPALGTMLNLAACHEKQGKTATAWAEFAEAQASAKRAGDTQRAELARTHLTALEKTLPRIVIEIMTPTPGLRVSLDGTELPREAWGTALPLDPGDHRIEASAEGRAPFVRKITLGPSGGTDRIEVTLAPITPTTSAPAGPEPGPAPGAPALAKAGTDPLWVGGWVSVGVGLAGLGTAVGMGVAMAHNVSQRDQLCPPGTPCSNQDAFSADHTARVDRLALFVSGGIGVAAVGAGVGLLVASRRKTSPTSPTSRVELTPVVSPTHAGLGLRGTF